MEALKTLGQRLLAARLRSDFTQEEVAKKIGEYQSKYRGWESDQYEPNIDTLIKLSDVLNVSIEWLVSGRGVMQRSFKLDRVAETPIPYGSVVEKVVSILYNMDETAQRDILKHTEEKKLISKLRKKKAG